MRVHAIRASSFHLSLHIRPNSALAYFAKNLLRIKIEFAMSLIRQSKATIS